MGIVQEKSGNTGATAAPTSFNATLDSATAAGTGRYVVIVVSSDNVVNTPSGFTLDKSQVNNAGHYVFRKAAADGETSWTVTPGAGGGASSWYAAELNDLTASSPLDVNASSGTGASGTTQSTGTTGTPTQDNLLMIASFSASVSGETDVQVTAYTNSYVERADEFTAKASGTDVGLYVATKEISAAAAQECTATYDIPVARTGIMVGYKLSGATPISVSDAGSSTDALAETATAPLADTASNSEATTVAAATPLGDAASSTEATTAAVAVPLADAAAGADSLSVDGGPVPKTLADTAGSADQMTATAVVAAADTAAGAEQLTVAAAAALAEAAAAIETVALSALSALVESGSAADAAGAGVGVLLVDVGSAVDAGTGADDSVQLKALSDAAAGLDRLRVTIHRPSTGTIFRPNTGTIARPNTGIILRP